MKNRLNISDQSSFRCTVHPIYRYLICVSQLWSFALADCQLDSLVNICAMRRASRTCNVRSVFSMVDATSAGNLTVISSSRIEFGPPINAENSLSSMYTTQKTVLQRWENSGPPSSSGTCLCMPSMIQQRRACPI